MVKAARLKIDTPQDVAGQEARRDFLQDAKDQRFLQQCIEDEIRTQLNQFAKEMAQAARQRRK